MVSTRRQRQAVIEASNPLKDAGILLHVFTFLPGNWLLLGAVCTVWCRGYAAIEDQQVRSCPSCAFKRHVTCGTKSTLYSAAVASPATARWASSCGLVMSKNWKFRGIAGFYAHAQTLATLFELGMVLTEGVVNAAALSGRLDILQHIITQQQCPRPGKLSYYAARSGNISMLNWLKAQSLCAFNDDTCAGAAEGGHLAALQHIRSEGCSWKEDSIACDAARGGNIEVLDWLRQQQGIDIDATVMMMAAFGGQTAMFQHLRSIGCSWDAEACDQAADFGHLDTLRWLREHGCPWDVRSVCLNEALCGFTDILDYIMEQGEVLDEELLTKALNMAGAFYQLQAAQWLRQHGAQWPVLLGYGDHDARHWKPAALAWARCTSQIKLNTMH
jgi:hypothetical protein